MWLYERDSDAPSVSSEPDGKQWQHIYRVSVICYILAKNGPIATKQKANILFVL